MIIALDARTVYSPQRRGTGKNLIDLYSTISQLRPDWEIIALRQIDLPEDPFENCANIKSVKIDIPGDRWDLWRKIRLPIAASQVKANVLHCPANLAAGPSLVPQVVTIHDLIPIDERFEPKDCVRRKWHKNFARAASRAAAIITPSEFSKKKIEQIYPQSSDKITVNHWAADKACSLVTDSDALQRVKQKYGLPDDKKIVLALGGADPRKNTARIIRAWALIDQQLRSESKLLVIGNQENVLGSFRQLRDQLNIADSAIIEGFASEADMAPLISVAEVMCYPSLSEGFGLPVLDSFACQTAVLTSKVTSLPEVAADAAILVDPKITGEIADGLSRLLSDSELVKELKSRGSRKLKDFSWQACAQRAIGVFEKFQ